MPSMEYTQFRLFSERCYSSVLHITICSWCSSSSCKHSFLGLGVEEHGSFVHHHPVFWPAKNKDPFTRLGKAHILSNRDGSSRGIQICISPEVRSSIWLGYEALWEGFIPILHTLLSPTDCKRLIQKSLMWLLRIRPQRKIILEEKRMLIAVTENKSCS